MLTSIIIRTLNEQKHLSCLLEAIADQQLMTTDLEIIIVDSGSNDTTLEIASRHGCRIIHIKQQDFTFGRSLNYGCKYAQGDVLVFISGHCIPVGRHWLEALIKPLVNGSASYTYGRQRVDGISKFSEKRHFEKWFPAKSKIPQEGYYCNNANAAICRKTWENMPFNEELTGLEDMYLAKQLVSRGEVIAYIADAAVYHLHDESWSQIKNRYERESLALQSIMQEVHFTGFDFCRYYVVAVLTDLAAAIREKVFFSNLTEILSFRLMQYWGTYRGNHEHRRLSEQQKRRYYYPGEIED